MIVGRASDSIYELLMALMVSLLSKLTLKVQAKYQILGTFSVHETDAALQGETSSIADWGFHSLL